MPPHYTLNPSVSMQQERPKVGLGVVIVRDGKILIGKRMGAHGANSWSIPGGHIEFGESWEACAIREAKEEVGLDLHQITYLGVTDDYDIGEGKHYVTIFVKAEAPEGEPRVCEPDKYIDLRWVRWEEVPSPRFRPLEKIMKQGVHPLATYYGKLVRDRIPEIIQERGGVAVTHEASLEEYACALRAKLVEEVDEFLQNGEHEELADILEVIHALTALHGTPREQLQLIQTKKRDERGGFENKIILDETRP